jgi:membrane associated rhomboid family serine protease
MDQEKRQLIGSLIYPSIMIMIMWIVKIVETGLGTHFGFLGLQPLHAEGLIGIVTAPFIHEDFSHLMANTVPFFILGGLIFFFYKDVAWKLLLLIWLTTGLWVWVFARGNAIHIGASGIVYGMASFLIFSGIFRRDARLMAITLLVTFIYGGIIWGLFPQLFPNQNISWESHLMGLIAGIVMAFFFRKQGPPRKLYSWDLEEDAGEPGDLPPDDFIEVEELPRWPNDGQTSRT